MGGPKASKFSTNNMISAATVHETKAKAKPDVNK